MRRHLWAVALACAGFVTGGARGGEVAAVTVEGDEVAGALDAFDPKAGLTIAGKTLKLEDVAELRMRGVVAFGAKDKARVHLRNGDVLCAAIVSGNETALKLDADKLGSLDLKLDVILGVVFPAKEPPSEAAIADFLGPREKDIVEDQVLRIKGQVENGSMEKFTDKELFFTAGGQRRKFPIVPPAEGQTDEPVAALRFGVLKPYVAAQGLQAQAFLSDGSRLSGSLTGFADGQFTLAQADGLRLTFPLASLRRVVFRGGRLTFLSALTPSAVEEKPLVGGAPVVLGWKRDLAVTGEKLRIGRTEYERGLGVRSYCKLTYPLGGQYARFVADVGMDSSATAGAVCNWQIVLDGQAVKSGAAKAGAAAEKVALELKGAKQLDLVCDYGADQDDAGDHLDWAGARLIK